MVRAFCVCVGRLSLTCTVLFTDTDSLFYHIVSEKDIYEDFWEDRELFDNSDYPESSKFFFKENKKVIGKFKMRLLGNQLKNL